MTGSLTVLDCTLRDGGYYTNWQFDRDLVNRYLRSVTDAGVDIIELGFRTVGAQDYLGPYAHTPDWLIESLEVPSARIGVMLNAADLRLNPMDCIDRMFGEAASSPVSIVRMATHLGDVPVCLTAADRLGELGYVVGVNLMQVSLHEPAEIQQAASELQACDAVSVLYFADSLGDMEPADVVRTVEQLSSAWDRPLGIHTHDNRRLALANSLAAIEAGVAWVDSTVRGMGRGAGNAQTEFLLAALARGYSGKYSLDPLMRTVMEDFADLQREHGWGADLLYLRAAEYGIHPTYVQMLQQDDRYELPDIAVALESLRQTGGHSFSTTSLATAIESGEQHPGGTWDPAGWFLDEDIVVLASSPQSEQHREAVERVVTQRGLKVLCLNATSPIEPTLITASVACHPVRVALEAGQLARLDHPVVLPQALLDSAQIDLSGDIDLLDYGVVVEPGRFETGEHSCVVPSRLALAYALAVCLRAGARRVLLVGLDGYPAGDLRQEQVQSVLDLFASLPDAPPLVAITPTTYQLERSSVYATEL